METSNTGTLCTRCSQTHFQPSSFIKHIHPSRGSFEYDVSIHDLQLSTIEDSCSWCGIVLEYVQDLLAKMSMSNGKPDDSIIADCGFTNSEVDQVKKGVGTLHIIVAIRDMKEAQSFTEKLIEIWVGSGVKHSRYFSAVALPSKYLKPPSASCM